MGTYLNGTRVSIAEVAGLREAIIGITDIKVGIGSEERTAYISQCLHDWRTRACECECSGPQHSISRGWRRDGATRR